MPSARVDDDVDADAVGVAAIGALVARAGALVGVARAHDASAGTVKTRSAAERTRRLIRHRNSFPRDLSQKK
jgi:hypothetical protein